MKVRNKKGFTLVELLVVIAILGVLAAIIIPRVSGNMDSAKTNTDLTNQKLLQNAVDRYYANTGSFPADLDALTTASPQYIDVLPAAKVTGKSFGLSGGKVTY